MKLTRSIGETTCIIESIKNEGRTVGLVPTMGALHEGHLSLIHEAKKQKTYVVVSVFVNPTQFDDPADLESYPRNLERDLEMLERNHVDLVFAPTEKEMYPEPDQRTFNFSPLDKVMEGAFRPGHFNGVAQVVSKLFEIISPDKAFFGQKDFQQLTIIKKLVEIQNYKVRVIGCPIIREKDGLAMSSRNQLLTQKERKEAPYIHKVLIEAKSEAKNYSPPEIKKIVSERITNHPLIDLEYFEIVDDKNLEPIYTWKDTINPVGCIAVKLGQVRLIDNIYFA
ncbi:MAG TPA: pantoate--beta-alanine ligase [Bacteroidales bacterium]|nr:pantoate--beta-alanine ligase [Bacteroidales bacterium]